MSEEQRQLKRERDRRYRESKKLSKSTETATSVKTSPLELQEKTPKPLSEEPLTVFDVLRNRKKREAAM